MCTEFLKMGDNVTWEEIQGNRMSNDNSEPYVYLPLTPGICVKMKTNNGIKVFINICGFPRTLEPQPDLDELMLNFITHKAVSPIHITIRKQKLDVCIDGSPCIVFDAVYNKVFVGKRGANKHFLHVYICGVLDILQSLLEGNISEHYKILKNRTVFGELEPLMLRESDLIAAKLISSVREMPYNTILKHKNTSSTNGKDKQIPRIMSTYVILKEPLEGPVKRLIGLFEMPDKILETKIRVLLLTNRIVITVHDSNVTYSVFISYTVNVKATKGYLDKNLRVLRLNMPVVWSPKTEGARTYNVFTSVSDYL